MLDVVSILSQSVTGCGPSPKPGVTTAPDEKTDLETQKHAAATLRLNVPGLKSPHFRPTRLVSGLWDPVAGLTGDVAALSRNVAALKFNVSGLKLNVAGLKFNVFALKFNVSALQIVANPLFPTT